MRQMVIATSPRDLFCPCLTVRPKCSLFLTNRIRLPSVYMNLTGQQVKLGRWLDRQRGFIKRSKMRADRLAKLQALVDQGLLFADALEEDERKWLCCYEALVAYGNEHGDCNVPHSYVIKLPNGSMAKLGNPLIAFYSIVSMSLGVTQIDLQEYGWRRKGIFRNIPGNCGPKGCENCKI